MERKNLTDRWIHSMKNQPFIAVIIILFILVMAVIKLSTDALDLRERVIDDHSFGKPGSDKSYFTDEEMEKAEIKFLLNGNMFTEQYKIICLSDTSTAHQVYTGSALTLVKQMPYLFDSVYKRYANKNQIKISSVKKLLYKDFRRHFFEIDSIRFVKKGSIVHGIASIRSSSSIEFKVNKDKKSYCLVRYTYPIARRKIYLRKIKEKWMIAAIEIVDRLKPKKTSPCNKKDS